MRRLAWLTALALVASCGGDPPKPETPVTVHRKKKKKKKKPVEVAEAKDESADSESKEDKRKKQEEEDAKEAEERRERQRKREQEEATKEADEQAVSSDQGGDSSESSSDEKSSDDEDGDKADEKKRKKEEAAEKKKEAAEEKKRKKEEAAEKKKEAAEEKKRKKEEAAEEAKAKKEAAAEAKKKKNKHSEEVDEEASSDDESAAKSSDDESSDEDEPKKDDKKVKKGKGKAKKVVAAKDKKSSKKKKDDEDEAKDEEKADSEDKAEKSDKAEKEVAKAEEPEEDSSSSLPPPDPENESKELDLEGGAVPTRDTGEDAPKVTAILAIDRRPLTNAKGKLDVHGGLRVAAVQVPSMGIGGKIIYNTATSEGFGLGGTYGVSDKIQVGLDYTVGLHPGSAKGPFSLSAAFRVTESEKLDIAVSAGFALDFQSKTDQTMVPPVTTTETIKGLQFGIWARYHLAPKFSVFTGLPSTPSSAAGIPASANLPPLPYHLSIGLGSKAAIAMELPVGVAYQASPKLYTFAMTSLGHLGMNNSDSAFIFADYIPFSVGGFYANDTKLDFGAVISDDVKLGTGFLRFDVVARYYLK